MICLFCALFDPTFMPSSKSGHFLLPVYPPNDFAPYHEGQTHTDLSLLGRASS